LNDLGHGFFEAHGLGQDARHRILRRQPSFGPSAIRDVADERAEDVGLADTRRRHGQFDRKLPSVLMPRDHLNAPIQDGADAGLEILSNAPDMRLPITRGNDGLREQLSQRLFAGPPEDHRSLGVPIRDDAGSIDGNHSVEHRIDDHAVTLLALQQGRLGGPRPGTFLLSLAILRVQTNRRPDQESQQWKPDYCDDALFDITEQKGSYTQGEDRDQDNKERQPAVSAGR